MNPELKDRLSKHELEYAQRYCLDWIFSANKGGTDSVCPPGYPWNSLVEVKRNHFLEAGMAEFRGETEREQELGSCFFPDFEMT